MASFQVPDTTLTMVVRDEIMNPAGGLLPLLERHAPYFSEVVVVDTGSLDGTRQLLEHFAGRYSHLRVYDAQFRGYDAARQEANDKVRTTFSFCLDADERVRDMRALQRAASKLKPNTFGLSFEMTKISPDGDVRSDESWAPRLFHAAHAYFVGRVWETVKPSLQGGFMKECIYLPSPEIYHFVSDTQKEKLEDWYDLFRFPLRVPDFSPSQTPRFASWKTPNPKVLRRYGINVHEVVRRLEEIGTPVREDIKKCVD